MILFARLPSERSAYPWRPGKPIISLLWSMNIVGLSSGDDLTDLIFPSFYLPNLTLYTVLGYSRRKASRRPGGTFKNGLIDSPRDLGEKHDFLKLFAAWPNLLIEVISFIEESIMGKSHIKRTKGWPAQTIPEDVFTTIAKFLSREDLCNLRLVNRECSLKLQDAMFRSVVVPFTTSVFSPSKTENSNAVDSESINIFEKLGDRIYKFGMSFEPDEGTILVFNTHISFVQLPLSSSILTWVSE